MNFVLISFGILCILMSEVMSDFTDDAPRGRNRCPFIKNSLRNGRVKIRSRGRVAKFICNPGYELVGSRFATCVRGVWNKQIPVCVDAGCPLLQNPSNGQSNVLYRGALVAFTCDPGYVLNGSSNVYCDGTYWNDTAPTCDIAIPNPKLTCDFEESTLCGWTNDRNHDFDWRRHQFSTPSGHVGTGPSYDHTLGKGKDGYYMYIEASSPRKQNDTARLFSPVYSSDLTPGCFVFWYHMYGATTGTLRVFMKKESQMFSELTPVWEREGEQGNLWLQSSLSIAKLNEKFQLIIEGIRGYSYVGDTAIDDVALYSTPCEELAFANITKEFDSCQGRCNVGMEENATCYCSEDCIHNATCCDDYENFCTKSANRTFIFGPEPQPKPLTTTDLQKFTTSTFTTSTATEKSRNVSKMSFDVVNTTVAPFPPNVSTSSNFTRLTTLPNSTFATTVSPNSTQTDLEKSSSSAPSGFKTPKITNETSNSTRKNVVETTVASVTTAINSSTETSTSSTPKTTMRNETIQPITESGKVEENTTRESSTQKVIIVQQPNTTQETTISQSATTESSKKTTQQSNISTIGNTTTKRATTFGNTTTKRPTTIGNTTTKQATTIGNITTKRATTIGNTTTKRPTTIQNTTSQIEPEIIRNQTLTVQITTEFPLTKNQTVTSKKKVRPTPKTSLKPKIILPQKKTSESTTASTQNLKTTEKTFKPIISITQKTTEKITTKATTIKTNVTRLPVTKPQSIPITQGPAIEMTTETSITTPKKTAINRTVSERFAINKKTTIPIETTYKTTKVSSNIDKNHSTTITAINPNTKKTRIYTNSTTKFRFVPTKKPNNKTIINVKNATINATLQPGTTSDIYTTAKTTAFPVNATTSSSPIVNKGNTSKLTPTKKLLHTETSTIPTTASSVETTKASAIKSEVEFTPNFGDRTELIWTFDYGSRTKKRRISRRPSKANSSIPLNVIAALATGIAVTTLFLIGITCFFFRKRKISQNKLSEDSEMKFLSDNEISEFSDPSLIIS